MSRDGVIRLDEWQAALAELSSRSVDGFTVAEMVEATGESKETVRRRLAGLIRVGRARLNGHRQSTRIDGIPCKVPVYKLEG